MMQDKDFVGYFRKILNRVTGYDNHWPGNVGYYHENGVITFDCWCMIKAVCWSNGTIADNYTVGNYAIYNPACGIGDWTGIEILNHCTEVSEDMSNIPIGAFLLYETNGHAGVYVGGGKVIECTASWGTWKVIESDIGPNGERSYNGSYEGRWYQWGKLPCVEYTSPREGFQVGDIVTITYGAKVYGSDSYFADWVYGTPLKITQLYGDRAVVSNDQYIIGAVSTKDLLPYEAPQIEEPQPEPEPEPEPWHPATPEPEPQDPPEDEKPTDPDEKTEEEVSWLVRLIRAICEVILEVLGKGKDKKV